MCQCRGHMGNLYFPLNSAMNQKLLLKKKKKFFKKKKQAWSDNSQVGNEYMKKVFNFGSEEKYRLKHQEIIFHLLNQQIIKPRTPCCSEWGRRSSAHSHWLDSTVWPLESHILSLCVCACLYIVFLYICLHIFTGLPWWLSGKEPACCAEGAGDVGSIPG